MILYTMHCPKCLVLKRKLDAKNLEYTECEDTAIMQEKGYAFLPVLEVGDRVLNFSEAVKYINEL